MSYLLFIDESGHDRKLAPYEVLAGLAIEDKKLWGLIQRIHELEIDHFGLRVSTGVLELKGKKLLKKKTFALAAQMAEINSVDCRDLARRCLEKGSRHDPPTKMELTALGQAKIVFTEAILDLCLQYGAKAFASIVPTDAGRSTHTDYLRKDYAYLFERFFYFLEDQPDDHMGLVMFDELDKAQSHILLSQVEQYFLRTEKGRARARLIIPEPFFVHSDLTTAIQLVDIIAYLISWGVNLSGMLRPRRNELDALSRQVCRLRYKATREVGGREDFDIWSFALIDDLRPSSPQK